MSDSDLHQRVLAAFQTEFKEQMQVIRAMLAAWPAVSAALLDDAFRMAHSMKGSARVCDLQEVETIAHHLESLLSDLTQEEATFSAELKREIEAQSNAAEDTMAAAMERELAPTSASDQASPKPTASQSTLHLETSLLDDLVQSSGLVLSEASRQESLSEDLDGLSTELERLRKLLHLDRHEPGDLRYHIREAGKHLQQIRDRQRRGSRTLRVLSSQLQEHVNRICLVPISSVFEGFPKMMRDLTNEAGKPIRFTMTGTELQADRMVLQALKDPVMHALRNAVSHGIESPQRRRQAGKAEEGDVRLDLQIENSLLCLTLTDDGQGVDVDRVKQKALQAGLITHAELPELSSEAITDLIFSSGLTTTHEVTRVSGRGMGLSIVRERVAQFQGDVTMTSEPGLGSRLEIRIPVSISARRLLLFKACGHLFALPLSALKVLLRVNDIHLVDGRSVVFWEGTSIQVTTASEAAGKPPSILRDGEGQILLAVLEGQRPIALHVESFLGEIRALIRPLPFPASLSPHFSGGIVTDEGSIILVLNPQTLVDRCRAVPLPEETPATTAPVVLRQATVLVVDDSFTARTLQKSILETAGYHVRTAEDGRAALNILHSGGISLVVSDVQMPHLDGFQLLSTMKAQPALTQIPVILVTSLSKNEDQERGLALGADAYIVKERFDHQELLRVVRQLV